MAAISKAWVAIADSAVDPDSPGDATLMTGIRDDLVHLREWLGASFFAGAVQDHNHDGQNSALVDVGPNLLRNGSFEDESAGWTITDYSGGSHAFSTSTRHHGAKSLAFTSTVLANGGGDALNTTFIPVAGGHSYGWATEVSASGANISSRVTVTWYDAAQSQISEVNLLNLAATPTSKRRYQGNAVAPSTARYARMRVVGGVPSLGSSTGTIFFDDVHFGVPGELILLQEQTPGAVAQVDFVDSITDQFDTYVIDGVVIRPANDNVGLGFRASTNNGSSFLSTNEYTFARHHVISSSASSFFGGGNNVSNIELTTGQGNAANEFGGFRMVLHRKPGGRCTVHCVSGYLDQNGNWATMLTQGIVHANDVNAIRFFWGSGNFAAGSIRLYGVKPS